VDEIDTVTAANSTRSCVTFGFGVPDLLDLQETPVASTDVVLPELEGGPPPGPFEFAAVCLLQDRAVLTLAQQALARRGKNSSDHGAILNDVPCGASVPIACEFHRRRWGQRSISVCGLWVTRDRALEIRVGAPSPDDDDDAPDREDGAGTNGFRRAPATPSSELEGTTMTDEHTPTIENATKGPRWLPALLIGLATVLAVVTTMTTWARTQALDTDQWVELSGDLLNEPEIQEALALYLSDQLFTTVDVAGELEARLPEDLSGLAGPLAGALRGPATDGIERLIASSRFQAIWQTANRVAHEAAVAILRDETRDSISTADGTIVLDLGVAVRNLGEQIGVPEAALDRLPDDVGQITVIQSSELADVQNAVKVLDFTSWFLYIVIVAMYVAAVYLAVGRRRQMLRSVGIALIIGGLTLLVIRGIGIRTSVEAFVEEATNKPLATLVASMMTELLRQMAWTGIVYGVLIIGFATVLGPYRWAVAVRRWVADVADSTASIVGISLGAVLVLLWWSPGRAFDRWVTALVLIGMVLGAIAALVITGRRELEADQAAPDSETTPEIDSTAVSDTVS
jgi:hypothetical protein